MYSSANSKCKIDRLRSPEIAILDTLHIESVNYNRHRCDWLPSLVDELKAAGMTHHEIAEPLFDDFAHSP